MIIAFSRIIATALLFLLSSCEIFYDPIADYDVPSSPGTAWKREPIVVKQTAVNPYTAADLSKEMSLSFLLEMALYNNPATRVSWNAARASAFAYRASLSPYYPTIGYFGTLSAQTNKGTSTASSAGQGIISGGNAVTDAQTFNSTFLVNNLALTYLLLDFGGRYAAAELALQGLYAADWQHDLTMQQVMLSVLNFYTSYIGNKALVAAFEQDLKDAQTALDAAKLMRSAGLATLTDELLAQSTLEQTRTSLYQAQGAEQTSLGDLLIAVGLPPDTKITVEQLPQQLPVIEISGNISSLLEVAKRNRPDLGIAIAAIRQQEAQLAISYSSGMPIITANASWNQVQFIHPKKPPGVNETAFLELNVPIFQGFYFMNQQRQLRAQVEAALANLDVQVAAVSTQIVTNYYLFTSAVAALPSSEAAVEYSQRAYKGLLGQYKAGTSSILDVLNALTSLSNARAQQIVIRTQWASSLANLAFSVGVLEDTSGHWQESPPKELYQLPIRDHDESNKIP